ncbi:hypothetical protein Tco_0721472, partial [Tanacetum coccineum]
DVGIGGGVGDGIGGGGDVDVGIGGGVSCPAIGLVATSNIEGNKGLGAP